MPQADGGSDVQVLALPDGTKVGVIFDGTIYRLAVDAQLDATSIHIGKVDQGVPAILANAWPVKITDGGNTLTINADGTISFEDAPLATAVVTSVPASLTTVTLAVADPARKHLKIYNNSALGFLSIKEGAGATPTDCSLRLGPRGFWAQERNYPGVVTGVWEQSSVGQANVTSLYL